MSSSHSPKSPPYHGRPLPTWFSPTIQRYGSFSSISYHQPSCKFTANRILVPGDFSTSLGIPLVRSLHTKHIRERNKERRGGNPVSSVLNALSLRFLSQRPNLEVTPFLLGDDDTVVHPPCAGRIWSEKEGGQHDLMRMIGIFLLRSFTGTLRFKISVLEHLTSTSSEDWAMVLDACKRASATEANAREATEALRRQLECVSTDFFP